MKRGKDKSTASRQIRQAAKDALDAALADEETALEFKTNLEQVMASLTTDVEEAKNMLTDLENVLKMALQMYKQARDKLVSEHSAGKGALAMSQVHMNVLSD